MPEVLAPERIISTRWRCPYCPRSRATEVAITEHIGRCWHNPAAQSCATCANFRPASVLDDPACMVGADLNSGEPHSALPVGCSAWEVSK